MWVKMEHVYPALPVGFVCVQYGVPVVIQPWLGPSKDDVSNASACL